MPVSILEDKAAQCVKAVSKHLGISREESAREVVQLELEEVELINASTGAADSGEHIRTILQSARDRRKAQHARESKAEMKAARQKPEARSQKPESGDSAGFSTLTVHELRDFAAAQQPPISLDGCTRKDQMIAAIEAGLAASESEASESV